MNTQGTQSYVHSFPTPVTATSRDGRAKVLTEDLDMKFLLDNFDGDAFSVRKPTSVELQSTITHLAHAWYSAFGCVSALIARHGLLQRDKLSPNLGIRGTNTLQNYFRPVSRG